MKILIKTIKGDNFQIEIQDNQTVQDIKNTIQQQKGIDAGTQKLIYKGLQLLDEKTVAEYQMKEGEFLVMMLVKKIIKEQQQQQQQQQQQEQQQQQQQIPVQVQPIQQQNQQQQQQQQQPNQQNPQPQQQQQNQQNQADVGGVNIASQFLSGQSSEYIKAVDEIVKMGFPKDQVEKAMEVAYNNPDRAIEYLINGIPENQYEQEFGGVGGIGGSGAQGGGVQQPQQGGGGNLQFLANNPIFQQLRERIQQDPEYLNEALGHLATTNPQLFQLISENQDEFMELLEGGDGGDDDMDQEEGQLEEITEQDEPAIQRLIGLGFPREQVIIAYLACGRDENLSANYLFDMDNYNENQQ